MVQRVNAFQNYIANSRQTDHFILDSIKRDIQDRVGYISNVLRGTYRRKKNGGFWKYEDRIKEAQRAIDLLIKEYGLTPAIEKYLSDIKVELNGRDYFKKAMNKRGFLQESYGGFSNSIDDYVAKYSTTYNSESMSTAQSAGKIRKGSWLNKAANYGLRIAAGIIFGAATLTSNLTGSTNKKLNIEEESVPKPDNTPSSYAGTNSKNDGVPKSIISATQSVGINEPSNISSDPAKNNQLKESIDKQIAAVEKEEKSSVDFRCFAKDLVEDWLRPDQPSLEGRVQEPDVKISQGNLSYEPYSIQSNFGSNVGPTILSDPNDTCHDLKRPTYFPPTAEGTWKMVFAKDVKVQALKDGKPLLDNYRINKHPIGDKIGGFLSGVYKSTVSQAFNAVSALLGGKKTGLGRAVNSLDDDILTPAYDFVAAIPSHAQDIIFVPTQGMKNRKGFHHVQVIGYLLPRDVTDKNPIPVFGPVDNDVVLRYRQNSALVNGLVVVKTSVGIYGLVEAISYNGDGGGKAASGLVRRGGSVR